MRSYARNDSNRLLVQFFRLRFVSSKHWRQVTTGRTINKSARMGANVKHSSVKYKAVSITVL